MKNGSAHPAVASHGPNGNSTAFPQPVAVRPSAATPELKVPVENCREAGRPWPVAMLGVPFDNVRVSDALARMVSMIASRRPHYVVTPNVDFLLQAYRDVELQRILLEADLVLCDGTPLVWASRLFGNALPERVAGADLVPQLISVAAERDFRVFLLGASAGVAAEAAAKLQAQHPTLSIAGHYSPPFNRLLEMDHDAIVQRIRQARPDILLVSFGCPKQEKWLNMHYRTLGVPVAVGVGGTLDFLAGRVKRAPRWMQRIGAEWTYRLAQEPRRLFRRYAGDLAGFFPAMFHQWWHLRPRSIARLADEEPAMFVAHKRFRVWAGRQFDIHSLTRESAFWREAMAIPHHCLLDLSQVRSIDSTGVAVLVQWRKHLLAGGGRFILFCPSNEVRRSLRALHLADHFLVADDPSASEPLLAAIPAAAPVQLLNHGIARVGWHDEVTAANVEDVGKRTIELLKDLAVGQADSTLVIDLSALRFIDSSGVGLMLSLTKWARSESRNISFTKPQRNVQNVLQLAQLDRVLLGPSE